MGTLIFLKGHVLPLILPYCRFIVVITFLCTFTNKIEAQSQFASSKPRLDFGIKLDICKKHSIKYFDNDTTDYSRSNFPWEFADNYLNITMNWKKYMADNWILNYECRYKMWGFKENVFYPIQSSDGSYVSTGTRVFTIGFDGSVSIMKNYNIFREKLYLRPKIGLMLSIPNRLDMDTTIYQEFGGVEINYNYHGPFLKIGGNIGLQLNYRFAKNYSLTISTEYCSPFNNEYVWFFSERIPDTHYPWRKWKKNSDVLYFGLGIETRFRRSFDKD